MKAMQLKLVAAAASLVVSGSALASIADGSGGNGELFFNIYDSVAQVSYVKDLGIFMNDFLPGSTAANGPLTFNLATDPNWLSFLPLVNSTNLRYNVAALDSTPANRYLSTTNDDVNTIRATQTNGTLIGFAGVNSYINAVNGLGSNPGSTSVNGSATEPSAGPTDSGYFGFGFAEDWRGKAKFNSMANVDTPTSFYELNKSSSSNLAKATVTPYAGQWNFTNAGLLTYTAAAVPEADTWAMMLAGVLTVGAIARRRMSV